MLTRIRHLPEGWYPRGAVDAAAEIDSFRSRPERARVVPNSPDAVAVVAPHASWFYSGRPACAALEALRPDAQTVIVFGGHLPASAPPLLAPEDAFDTPFGPLAADAELRSLLRSRFSFADDDYPDNTVEIQLPFVKRLFPAARILWLRMPASMESFRIGGAAAEAAAEIGRIAVAVGSTDLTHYGPAYGFLPKGGGPAALEWVRGVNDRRFIDALLASDAPLALSRAAAEESACSPGAAVAALGFAAARGAGRSDLLAYATSADQRPAASFVGYAAISWTPR